MASIPVMCLICNKSIKDSMFPQHMQSVHGGLSQSEAMMAEKNIPTQQPPIVLDKDAPPSADFMEVAKMLDEKPPQAPPPVVPARAADSSIPKKVEEIKPIILKYRFEGDCPKCKTPIKTVVIKPGGKWFAVAFCLTHEEITQQEVSPLIKEEQMIMASSRDPLQHELDKIEEVRKEVKKRDKQRSKPKFFNKTPIQSPVSAS